jgi:hypothetical protein
MINESVFLPSLIAAGPLVLGVGDEGVADGLIQLERTGHAVEAAGCWQLTEACWQALDGERRSDEPRWPI